MIGRRTPQVLGQRDSSTSTSLALGHHPRLVASGATVARRIGQRGGEMARYVIAMDAHAMDAVPTSDLPAVADAAHAVCREAIEAGVFVVAGGIVDEPSSVVAPDGSITEGARPESLGGFVIVEVPTRDEARRWAARFAAACRCAQEVWEVGPDPELDELLEA